MKIEYFLKFLNNPNLKTSSDIFLKIENATYNYIKSQNHENQIKLQYFTNIIFKRNCNNNPKIV